jgi:hypothetical protein
LARLNSELSVRVDELSNEIRNLQGENLRLRQTVISLVAQLKREREKSRKILADTEVAVRPTLVPRQTKLNVAFTIDSQPNETPQLPSTDL